VALILYLQLNLGVRFVFGSANSRCRGTARTAAFLSERFDQHRGRGQQQITERHVTVNADQAVVTDQIVSDKSKATAATNLLMAGTDKPMEIIESTPK
jgi:hypothetical protein